VNEITTEKETAKEPELTPSEVKLFAAARKLVENASDEAGIKKLLAFREQIMAARACIPRFNKALAVARDFRGADYALGVEPIVRNTTDDGNKPGRPKLTEAEKLAKLFG
jgi:hypothetical protein